MQTFIAFFKRFSIFFFFVLLQIIALPTYLQYSSFPKSQFLTSASSISGNMYSWKAKLLGYFSLEESNKLLKVENAMLRKKISGDLYQVNRNTYKIVDTSFEQQYEYIPARIINSTVTKRNNYFTLDCGSLQGVVQGMGVFSPNGIIGIVHNTSSHYSVVKSLLTQNINIDVEIEGSGLFGFLKWNGKSPLKGTITGVSNDAKIKKGARVVTRETLGLFPRGLIVGYVESFSVLEGKPLWDITIKFNENYSRVKEVCVIKNLLLPERKILEQKVPNTQDKPSL
jgi:rod shape-determining protein MreC